MASLRFLTINFIEAATLENGTGGGAPARSETSPYVMENAGTHERRQLWQKGSVANLDVDWHFASAKNIKAGGIAGHRGISGAGITSYDLKYQTGAYNPAGVWTSLTGGAVNVSGLRDKGSIFGQVAADSVRFSLVVASIFTLGKFFVGTWDYDLGFLYSPGTQRNSSSPMIEDRTVGQDPVRTFVGDDRERWTISWGALLNADAVKLETLRALRTSFMMADKVDVFREFIVSDATLSRSITFEQSSDTVQTADVELEQLG